MKSYLIQNIDRPERKAIFQGENEQDALQQALNIDGEEGCEIVYGIPSENGSWEFRDEANGDEKTWNVRELKVNAWL